VGTVVKRLFPMSTPSVQRVSLGFVTDASIAVATVKTVSAATVTERAANVWKAFANLAFETAATVTSNFAQIVYLKTKGVSTVKKKRKRTQQPETPKLRFTPNAWAKLLYLRDYGDTEVGGFGICPSHPLLVEDIRLVKQTCTFTTVSFDDESVADFFEDQVADGLSPEQFARVWIHTHPGASAQPSHTDEETFERVFGKANWAVMAILACGGESFARLRLNGGLEQGMLLNSEVDFAESFTGAQFAEWEDEYFDNVVEQDSFLSDPWDWTSDDLINPSPFDSDSNQYLDSYPEETYLNDQFEQYEHAEFRSVSAAAGSYLN
jgi:proteasome lid subunit RPN8/RPN11